jgi:hypothetical protein
MFLDHVSYDCQVAEGGKSILIHIGKLRCSTTIYCGRQSEITHCRKKNGAVLPHSPNEYRTRYASTEKLDVLQIPQM